VAHHGEIETVCPAFRQVLNDLQARLEKNAIVHAFYAGPVSLGFSLGRWISWIIHHRAQPHDYDAVLRRATHGVSRLMAIPADAPHRSGRTVQRLSRRKALAIMLMYDPTAELQAFYDIHVRLGTDRRRKLGEHRDLNVARLNGGLDDWAAEPGRARSRLYANKNQGSYAMQRLN
jgi:hypothetical protein